MAKYEEDYDEKYDDELDYEGGEQQPDLDKKLKGYRIIIIALVAVLGLLTFQHFRVTSQIREDFRIERDTLNNQINGLITEIDQINLRNDSVSNELRLNIATERHKADSLMSRLKKERNMNREKLRAYEKELGTLRTIMKRYLGQIDSLNNLNKKLVAENVGYRKKVADEKSRADIAEERAAELSNKIKLGAIVKARNVQIAAYNTGGTNVTREQRRHKGWTRE